MTDRSTSDFRPQGDGPHPTLAGNLYDPNVSADGQKGGQGVGGTSERAIKDEATEHISQRGSSGHHSSGTSVLPGQGDSYGTSSGLTGQNDSYNTGSGLSGRGENISGGNAYPSEGEPTGAQQQKSGLDYIKGMVGLGSSTGSNTGTTSGTESGYGSGLGSGTGTSSGAGYGSGTGSGIGSGIGSSTYDNTGSTGSGLGSSSYDNTGSTGSDLGSSTYDNTGSAGAETGYGRESATGAGLGSGLSSETGTRSAGIGSESGTGIGRDSSSYGSSTLGRDSTNPSTHGSYNDRTTDSDVRSGTDPTTSADPTTSRTAQDTSLGHASEAGHGATGLKSEGSSVGHSREPPVAKAAQAAEHDNKGGPPPSIPTAGGERIGTKHWGESKVIPDNPPRRASADKGAGVSSAAGQADDLTKKNTASNTGGATDSTAHKESAIDKLKDKLHMGHK